MKYILGLGTFIFAAIITNGALELFNTGEVASVGAGFLSIVGNLGLMLFAAGISFAASTLIWVLAKLYERFERRK